jgi:GTPase SAR1 family protein
MRYCHGEFPENATPTIGASFLQRRIAVEGTEISLQIWDTAGQERFRSMAPMVILDISSFSLLILIIFF